MKRALIAALLLSGMAAAQQTGVPQQPQQITNLVERASGPTYSDQYCAGYITNKGPDAAKYVIAGAETPFQADYSTPETIFLEGSGYAEGGRYTIIRALKDPNQYEMFPGQRSAIAGLGAAYAEVGRVKIKAVRGENAVADIEFACQQIVPGDYVVPFAEKPPIVYKAKASFDRFPPTSGSLKGRILLAKEFDSILGQGNKVYLNVGADKGVKVGDYFRAVRGYDPNSMNQVDALSYKINAMEDTQGNAVTPSAERYGKLPLRALGEMIVLEVTPSSATAMITLSLESINVGDYVELEGPGAPPSPNQQ